MANNLPTGKYFTIDKGMVEPVSYLCEVKSFGNRTRLIKTIECCSNLTGMTVLYVNLPIEKEHPVFKMLCENL